ncbi:MAG: MFS transporter [Elusimicrobia bacterium]|nr:MFS transporter [Elusimicrobiota bacterium]
MSKPKTALRALLLCHGVLVAGLALSFPFLTLYFHHQRAMPMGLVGLAVSGAVAAAAVGQAIGGELADVFGCKRVMAIALASRVLFTALLAAAVALDWAVPAIVALHVAGAASGNLYGPAVRAWIAHEHPAGGRAHAYGFLRVAQNAGWAIGPAVGGFMAGYSYALMFAATSAMSLLGLILLLGVVPAAPPVRSGEGFAWSGTLAAARDGRFLELSFLGLIITCVMSQLVAPMSVHATAHGGLSETQVGFLFGINGVIVVLLQRSATRLSSRWPLSRAAAAGCLFYLVGWSWVAFARGWWPMALGMAVVTLGEIVISPSLEALAANLAPGRLKGRSLGFQGLMQALGQALGPLLGGLGFEHFAGRWTPAPWLAAGALAGAAGWGFRRLGRRLEREEEGMVLQEVA